MLLIKSFLLKQLRNMLKRKMKFKLKRHIFTIYLFQMIEIFMNMYCSLWCLLLKIHGAKNFILFKLKKDTLIRNNNLYNKIYFFRPQCNSLSFIRISILIAKELDKNIFLKPNSIA